ncbi:hypothetical protein [Microvirga flavescens]|uniref:hypothetical protein n=1 Tax=Microvirga flavescens TaxID=2249811 RepID=UPI001300378E|nr:hypothetical protein [Microvirga flavescens]
MPNQQSELLELASKLAKEIKILLQEGLDSGEHIHNLSRVVRELVERGVSIPPLVYDVLRSDQVRQEYRALNQNRS